MKMKKYHKILLVIINISIILSPLGQNVRAAQTLEIGNYILSAQIGSYYIWSVTEADGAPYVLNQQFYDDNKQIQIGDKFKMTIISKSYWPVNESDFLNPVIGDNPCIVGKLEYYNKLENKWFTLGEYRFSDDYFAILMFEKTLGILITAEMLYTKFFLTVLPANLNLTNLGDALIFYSNYYSYGSQIDSYVSTDNTLNLTFDENYMSDSGTAYNFIEVNNQTGIVSTWDYRFDGYEYNFKIVAIFDESGKTSPGITIPFGSEYLIPTMVCIISLIYIIKKHVKIDYIKDK